jgi:hypothetical protein
MGSGRVSEFRPRFYPGAEFSYEWVGAMRRVEVLMRGVTSVAMLWTVIGFPATGLAVEQSAGKASDVADLPGPSFRRIFVPNDRPEAWPTAGQRYLPLDRNEFERALAVLHEQGQLQASGAHPIEKAVYTATFGEDGILRGKAVLGIRLAIDGGQVIRLAPLNIAITDAQWKDAGETAEPALLGSWRRPGGSQWNMGVLANRSGELEIHWAAAPRSSLQGGYEYVLQLPTAISRQLALQLPSSFDASMSGAAVTNKLSADSKTRTYSFALAAGEQHVLSITPGGRPQQAAALAPTVGVSETYEVAPDGLDYEGELRIQPRGSARAELRVTLPGAVRVTDVRVDGARVNWRRDDHDADVLLIPTPDSSSVFTVKIVGVAQVTLNSAWTLPRLKLSNDFWNEGASTLWIHPALELKSLEARGASLQNIVGIGADAFQGEAFRLQAWSAEATTEVVVGERAPALSGVAVLQAEFADRELLGQSRATLWAVNGAVLQANATVGGDWAVEAVEASPAEDLIEWHMTTEGPARKLYFELRRSPTESAPLKLSITSRRQRQGGPAAVTLGDLNWLRFDSQLVAFEHLQVSDRRRGAVTLEDPNIDAMAGMDSLSSEERLLLGDVNGGQLFDIKAVRPEARILVASARPRYRGEAWIELAQSPAGFEHEAEILCRPISGILDELTVEATRPLPAEARWIIVGSGEEPVVEPVGTGSATMPAGNQSASPTHYRVRLPSGFEKPFRLRISWRDKLQDTASINGLVVRGSETWQSWAILRGDPSVVQVDAKGCAPAAAMGDVFDQDNRPSILGCYRLSDDPLAPLGEVPSLTVKGAPSSLTGGAVCWRCDVTTLLQSDGAQIHRLIYELEPNGEDELELSAGEKTKIAAAQIDGMNVALASPERKADGQDAAVVIRLPANRRRVQLSLDVESVQSPLAWGGRIYPPSVSASFPVVRGRWTLHVPPGFACRDANRNAAAQGWLSRLFGPLARGGDHEPRDSSSRAYAATAEPVIFNDSTTGEPTRDVAVPTGWSSFAQEFAGAPSSVQIARPERDVAWRYLTFLVFAVAVARLWPHAPRFWSAVLLGLGLAAEVLPIGWIALPQAGFLGVLGGIGFSELMRRVPERQAAAAVALALGIQLAAQTQALSAPMEAPPSVLFPIGADGKAAGTDVYVPESLFKKLEPGNSSAVARDLGSVLLSAHYRLGLKTPSEEAGMAAGELTLNFRYRTFQRNTRIELSLVREEANWTGGAILDGKAVEGTWNVSGHGYSVLCLQPGVHEISLTAKPRGVAAAGRSEVRLHVPRLPNSTVEVLRPGGLKDLRIAGAVLDHDRSSPTTTLARLGSADELQISWASAPSGEGKVKVDQLSVLHIEAAASRVDVRLQLSGDGEPLKKLNLLVAPELKLLPVDDSSPFEVLETTPGSPTTIALNLKQPLALPLTLNLQFQVQRNMSLGRFDFPLVSIPGAEISSHYFAVAAAPSLMVREEAAAGLTVVTPAELAKRWTEFTDQPDQVRLEYAVTTAAPAWSIQVEPQATRIAARESLQLLCTKADVEVVYNAVIEQGAADVLRYRVALPPNLAVSDVRILSGMGESSAPIRWSRPSLQQVCIYLGQPVTGRHRILVKGRLDYANDRRLPVPWMGLDASSATSLRVSVLRTSDVLVQTEGVAPGNSEPAAPLEDPNGISVAQFAIPRQGENLAALEIASNDVHFTAESAITVEESSAEPIATYFFVGSVERGVVDRIQFIASKNWHGLFSADSGLQVSTRVLPGNEDDQLVEVRLGKPAARGTQFRIRIGGALAVEPGRRLRFPDVRTSNANADERYVLFAGNAGQWTKRGLEPAALPESLRRELDVQRAHTAYHVMRRRFVAEQRFFPQALQNPVVRLAVTDLTVNSAGDWSAVSQLIVQPGGATVWSVKPPTDGAILYASIDDRAIPLLQSSDGAWQAPPGPAYLPRILTLAYRCQSRGSSTFNFELPRVLVENQDIAVARSLWRVASDAALKPSPHGDETELTTSTYEAAVRHERIAAVVEASPLVLQLPDWESHEWLGPWLRRIARTPAFTPADSASEAAWTRLVDQFQGSRAEPSRVGGSAEQDASYTSEVMLGVDLGSKSLYFQSDGAGSLMLRRDSPEVAYSRWLAAFVMIAVGGVVWKWPQRVKPIAAAFERWPFAFAMFAGAMWWMLLTPRIAGAAIVLVSIAAMLKQQRVSRKMLLTERQSTLRMSEGRSSQRSAPVA